jgi:hypothetical protein
VLVVPEGKGKRLVRMLDCANELSAAAREVAAIAFNHADPTLVFTEIGEMLSKAARECFDKRTLAAHEETKRKGEGD